MVVVAAPEETQESIQQVLEVLSKAEPASPINIQFSWWVVAAELSPQVDTGALPPALSEPMAEIAALEPSMRYTVRHATSLLALDGDESESSDGNFSIRQVASTTPQGSVLADLDIRLEGGINWRTRAQLQPGQTLVLGQTGTNSQGERYFYVVRPELK
jgi:hypothetical protein